MALFILILLLLAAIAGVLGAVLKATLVIVLSLVLTVVLLAWIGAWYAKRRMRAFQRDFQIRVDQPRRGGGGPRVPPKPGAPRPGGEARRTKRPPTPLPVPPPGSWATAGNTGPPTI